MKMCSLGLPYYSQYSTFPTHSVLESTIAPSMKWLKIDIRTYGSPLFQLNVAALHYINIGASWPGLLSIFKHNTVYIVKKISIPLCATEQQHRLLRTNSTNVTLIFIVKNNLNCIFFNNAYISNRQFCGNIYLREQSLNTKRCSTYLIYLQKLNCKSQYLHLMNT